MKYSLLSQILAAVLVAATVAPLAACSRSGAPVLAVTKVNRTNFDSVHTGMSKAQVEAILGAPTSVETKDFVVYKRTVYRYEQGDRFISVTFKNDEVDGKDTNLGT